MYPHTCICVCKYINKPNELYEYVCVVRDRYTSVIKQQHVCVAGADLRGRVGAGRGAAAGGAAGRTAPAVPQQDRGGHPAAAGHPHAGLCTELFTS